MFEAMNEILIKRVYEAPAATDGKRILVDRLWPRGLSKAAATIAHWVRDVAPSDALRAWYKHDPDKWEEFQRRYFVELDALGSELEELRQAMGSGRVTFVFAAREAQLNNAAALKAYLER